jgi:CTP:molybdopterin cytidylyltransferase MocA
MTRLLIIPAAGRGSRLGTDTPKPLVLVDGRTMLQHLADLYREHVHHIVVVAHPHFAAPIAQWGAALGNVSVATQDRPTGMLDAILEAAPAVRRLQPDAVWITWADQIGVRAETVRRLAAIEAAPPLPALALPTVWRRDPYIHFERDASGRLSRLRQRREGDVMPDEGESDIGLFALTRPTFETDLPEFAAGVVPAAGTGERNFVPFVTWLAQRKFVATFPCSDPMEAVGVNTPDDLRAVETWLRTRGAAE